MGNVTADHGIRYLTNTAWKAIRVDLKVKVHSANMA